MRATQSRFLFTAWPLAGHVFPQVAVAHALARRGHEVAFYTGGRMGEIIRGEGFRCFPFARVDEDAIATLMSGRPAEPWRVTKFPQMATLLRRWLLDTVSQQVGDIEDVIASWGPRVIATDPTMWGPVLVVADKLRIKVAVCSFIPLCPLPGPDAPPFGPGLPRSGGVAVSAATWVARTVARLSARVGRRTANEIRRQHGLGPIDVSPTEYTGRMPLYLVPSTPEFDYDRRDLPPSVRYVGPYLWNRPSTEPPTDWVAGLRRDVPCVHVTEGTFHAQRPFVLQAALAGLADLPLQVVATTGDRPIDEIASGPIPPNIRLERWVSHADLLPRTDVMVTTGGAGSVLAALSAGVPLVLVPTEWDKPDIAQRVVEAGAGIRLAPRLCTPARLRERVLEALRNPTYRANARRLAEQFGRAGGAETAADLLVALCDAGALDKENERAKGACAANHQAGLRRPDERRIMSARTRLPHPLCL